MQLISRKIKSNSNIFCIGDDHEGTILRHADGWNQMVDMMHSDFEGCKNNYAVDHGDIIEGIKIDDPRYDGKTTEANILKEIKQAIENRKPIKKKIITILDGNHPMKLWRFGEITKEVCDSLGVCYGTLTAIMSYHDQHGLMFKHFAAHGKRGMSSIAHPPSRRIVNLQISLRGILEGKAGDCLVMSRGHTHKLIIAEPISSLYLTNDGDTIMQHYTQSDQTSQFIHPDHRWYVSTGSFYKLYHLGISGYAEAAEYDPLELGFAVIMIRNRKVVDVKKVVLS